MPKVLMGPGPIATTTTPGQMSAADKTKLDGIPASTISDTNKFLRGNGSWDDPVVILTYGVSTYNEFLTAFNRGASIYCKAPVDNDNNPNNQFPRYAQLSYVNPTLANAEFLYYRAQGHSSSTYTDEVYIYTIYSDNSWGSTHKRIGINQVAISGDGLSASYEPSTLTLTTSPFTGATSSVAGIGGLVPTPTISDYDKFLCGDGTWAAIGAGGTPISVFTGATSNSAGTSGLVPAPASGDTNKFLRSDGSWATITGGSGGISGINLLSASLTPDGNGIITIPAMTACSASVAGAAGVVPAPAMGDQDKFLSGDGTWKAGGLPMVILSYGNSTWQSFIDAYNNNVIVYCRASSNTDPSQGSQTRMAFMAYVNNESSPTEVEFQYYRSVSSHTSSNMCDQVFIYKLNKTSGWSVTSRYAGLREIINNATGITLSYNNNKITIADA